MNKRRQIEIKDEYFKLILDIGFDYKSWAGTTEALEGIIDSMLEQAERGLENNTTSVIYERGDGKKLNVLREEL